jgi:hypothetical protein
MSSLQSIEAVIVPKLARRSGLVAVIDHEKLVNWIALGSLIMLGVKLLLSELVEITKLVGRLCRRSSTDASNPKS